MARIRFLAFGWCSLLFALGACAPALPTAGGPVAPCAVSVSPVSAEQFVNRVAALSQTRGKDLSVTATNQEVSSLLGIAIEQARQGSIAALVPIENPIVCFKRGEMSLYGGIKPDGKNAISALFTMDGGISNGKITFRIKRAEVGPFSVPQDLGDTLSTWLSKVLNDNLQQMQLVGIDLEEGQIRLTGRFQ